MLEFFFSSYLSVPLLSIACVVIKKKIQQRNSLITKERKKFEKNNVIHSLFCFISRPSEVLFALSMCYHTVYQGEARK